ncbi:MAG: S9 family peptidase [Bacteroidota bacterium]|nr:S9 family peptidase [Bacteroidota bacterium]
MKRIAVIALLLFIAGFQPVVSQGKLTAEMLWKFGRVSEPRLSPDGKQVLYSVKFFNLETNKGDNNLYLVPVAGGAPFAIAAGPENDHTARWRPDGKKIMFLSAVNGKSQLFEMNPDGSGRTQVTAMSNDISGYSFSPAGDKLWMTMETKTGKTTADRYPDLPMANGARIYDDLMYRHWDHWEDENSSHIFVVNYANGKASADAKDIMGNESFESPLQPFGDEEQIAWSPDGKQIAYTSKKQNGREFATGTNSDIYLYDLASGITENISEGMPGYDTKPVFSPDGKKIIWLSMATPMYEADRNRIFEYDFATKAKKELTTGYDYTADAPVFSKDGKSIYFMAGINATDQVWQYDASQKAGQQFIQLTKEMADVVSFSMGYDGKNPVMVTNVMSISSPSELFTVDMKTGVSKQITFTNKEVLSTIKMGKVDKRMVKTTDGKEMLTWVIYPPDFDPAKKYPTLLYCQGGPQSTVSQFFSYRWNFQLMAAHGYIVVAPNRRGLPSFGEKWNRDISGDWGGQAMKDLTSAIDDVSKEPFVNKDKLGAVGASFGGYSVYWLAGNHNKRFKAFVSHCGVFNLESMYGTTEEIFFADFDMNGSYFKSPLPKSYTEFNPIRFVNNWDTPILVIHNDKDFRVPISQGMEAFTAARMKNIPARFLSFPDENHWVIKPQNSVLWQREFFGFLDSYLK